MLNESNIYTNKNVNLKSGTTFNLWDTLVTQETIPFLDNFHHNSQVPIHIISSRFSLYTCGVLYLWSIYVNCENVEPMIIHSAKTIMLSLSGCSGCRAPHAVRGPLCNKFSQWSVALTQFCINLSYLLVVRHNSMLNSLGKHPGNLVTEVCSYFYHSR